MKRPTRAGHPATPCRPPTVRRSGAARASALASAAVGLGLGAGAARADRGTPSCRPDPGASSLGLLAGAAAPAGFDPAAEAARVRALQATALRRGGLDPERADRWSRRLRASAILPQLRVRVALGAIDASADTDASPLGAGASFTANRVEVAATWALDRLVFAHDDLALAREAQRLAMRREAVGREVSRLYFALRRLELDLAARPADGPADAERRIAIEELRAELGALTGGPSAADLLTVERRCPK